MEGGGWRNVNDRARLAGGLLYKSIIGEESEWTQWRVNDGGSLLETGMKLHQATLDDDKHLRT